MLFRELVFGTRSNYRLAMHDEQGPQRDGEGTVAGLRSNDRVAPIPAVPLSRIEGVEPTESSRYGPHASAMA